MKLVYNLLVSIAIFAFSMLNLTAKCFSLTINRPVVDGVGLLCRYGS